jgi:CheY-like chemotaxis protein
MIKPSVVFIIDDDEDDQEFLIDALKDIDPFIKCFTASNGQEGLKKLETNTIPTPSIIFLDLNMPRINGRQVLAKLKKDAAFKVIPVIIYTTSSSQKDMDELKALGAIDYLVKQSDDAVLKEQLIKIIQYE